MSSPSAFESAYGLEPVGKGQAAAGFRAVLAPGASAADAVVPSEPGAAGFAAGFLTAFRAAFTAGFFFFLADLPATFLRTAFFFTADFFDLFFFFLAGFLADFFAFLFVAMATNLLQGLKNQHQPARPSAGYPPPGKAPGR